MAGTITGTFTRIMTQQGRPQIAEMVLTCKGDASNGSFPQVVINDLACVSGLYDLRGLKLYSVKSYPGTIPPTDESDLEILDKYGIDLLGGKGLNLIDATSKTWVPVGPSSFALPALITGDITVSITNNSVNKADVTIALEFTGD
jgi:hypothetical protein